MPLIHITLAVAADPVVTTDAHTLTAVSGPMGATKSNHQTGYFEHPRLPRSMSIHVMSWPRSCVSPQACCCRRRLCTACVCTACAHRERDSFLFVQCFRRMGNSSISNWILPTLQPPTQPASLQSQEQTIYPIPAP
jgi:hypothetical protein